MAPRISRRVFLAGSAASAAAASAVARLAPASASASRPRSRRRLVDQVLDRSVRQAAAPQGTTLSATIRPIGNGAYRRLVDGPGEPTAVRDDLQAPLAGREDRRVALASFVHLTDQHLIDAQSPGRVEFLDAVDPLFQSAFRPQELFTTQVATSMVQRINALARGPVTGRRFDAAVCTGDNVDNQQSNELGWLLTILDGGEIVPDSGNLGTYEGVQDNLDTHRFVWHPEPGMDDDYKALQGFPNLEGLTERALQPFRSPGLNVPWFSVYGNHDCNIQGNAARSEAIDQIFTGDRKMIGLPRGTSAFDFILQVMGDSPGVLRRLRAGAIPFRTVTPDPGRQTATIDHWIRAHLASPTGSHGFHAADVAADRLYYEFDISPGVVGLALDTTNHAGGPGGADGSIGSGQLAWLEDRLAAHSSRHLAPDGSVVRTGGADRMVVVFSHHTAATMTNNDRDPAHPAETRLQGPGLVSLLVRYPNVVAWVNGHTHTNGIQAHRHPQGLSGGFWEVTSASHVDWPQQARVIELADNLDGTISLFGTMIEHAAEAVFDPTASDVLSLASLSRELGANDANAGPGAKTGGASDRNVELVLAAPFADVAPPPAPVPTSLPTSVPAGVSGAVPAVPVGGVPSFTG